MTSFGKHEGDLPGAPRTGNELKMTSITIHRIADGKLAEKWSEKDVITLLKQIGVMKQLLCFSPDLASLPNSAALAGNFDNSIVV